MSRKTSLIALLTAVVLTASACGGAGSAPVTFLDPANASPSGDLVLGADGLGVTVFGDSAEEAFAAVARALGREPDTDTDWTDAFAVFGTCPGTVVRAATWGDLMVIAGNPESALVEPGTRHFYTYRYRIGRQGPEGLETAEGIGIGSTIANLKTAFGDSLVLFPTDTALGGPRYEVNPVPGSDILLSGIASGVADDDVVLWIDGGVGCA